MRKIKAPKLPIPLEDDEQKVVVQYLQAKGLLFTHPANGSNKSPAARVRFKKLGQSAGFPDLAIFNPCRAPVPSGYRHCVGLAIEMKRRKGGVVSPEQKQWLLDLELCGWLVRVCHGADEAIALIDSVQWVKV